MPLLLLLPACLVGSLFSLYAYHVELSLDSPGFVPLCDSAAHGWSCSRVFAHPGGHLLSFVGLVPRHSALDISSALLGFAFYLFCLLWSLFPVRVGLADEQDQRRKVKATVQLGAALFSGLISIFMSYVMVTMVREICIVCSTMYFCNLLIFVDSVVEFFRAWNLLPGVCGPRTPPHSKAF